jgi:hypothetical protein
MKQHPDRQPRRAIAMQCGNEDDRQTDQEFEGDGIDGVTPLKTKRKGRKGSRKERKDATNNSYIFCVPLRNPLRPLRLNETLELESFTRKKYFRRLQRGPRTIGVFAQRC